MKSKVVVQDKYLNCVHMLQDVKKKLKKPVVIFMFMNSIKIFNLKNQSFKVLSCVTSIYCFEIKEKRYYFLRSTSLHDELGKYLPSSKIVKFMAQESGVLSLNLLIMSLKSSSPLQVILQTNQIYR